MEGGKKIMIIIALIIASIIVLLLITASIWSWRAESSQPNKVFNAGSVPKPDLNGPFQGIFSRKVSWQGKEFDAKNKAGINNFEDGQRYVFKTSEAKSLKSDTKVIKIDYDQPENPWWLKFVVDEVVQIKPDEYQGKVYLKIGPATFTAGYFQLRTPKN